MKTEKIIQIQEGITLHILPTDKFKTSFVSFSLVQKLSEKENTKTALLPFVLKGASEKYPDLKSLNRALDALYGASLMPIVRKKGDWQMIGFCMDFVADAYALAGEKTTTQALDLFKEVIFNPKVCGGAFQQNVVDIEKGNLKDTIESIINDKRTWALLRCIELMCKGEPLALSEYGQIADLAAISPEALYAYYKELLETARIELFYEGGLDTVDIEAFWREAFSSVQRRYKEADDTSLAAEKREELQYITEEVEVNQCKLNLGFHTGITAEDERIYALMVANAVFGGGPNSKLFLNVREKMGLCYYAASRAFKQNGMILVYSGIEKENEEAAVTEIKRQLQDMREGMITDEEIEQAKLAMVNSLKSIADSAFSTEDFLLGEALGKKAREIDEYIGHIWAVKKEEVVAVAKEVKLDTVYVLSGKA